jgi:hypothetical protein
MATSVQGVAAPRLSIAITLVRMLTDRPAQEPRRSPFRRASALGADAADTCRHIRALGQCARRGSIELQRRWNGLSNGPAFAGIQ